MGGGIKWGTKLSSLTLNVYRDIISIYDEVMEGNFGERLDTYGTIERDHDTLIIALHERLVEVLADTKTHPYARLIFSRSYTHYEDGVIKDIDLSILCDPHDHDTQGTFPKESLQRMSDFQEKLIRYLSEKGILIQLNTY